MLRYTNQISIPPDLLIIEVMGELMFTGMNVVVVEEMATEESDKLATIITHTRQYYNIM